MEKEIINRYLINFRRYFTPYLKTDVSVKNSVFPYVDGAIIIMELGYNSSNNTEYRVTSRTLTEAMERTNLFDDPASASPIFETKIVTIKNRIIIMKNDNMTFWSEKAAHTDVNNLMASLKDSRNG